MLSVLFLSVISLPWLFLVQPSSHGIHAIPLFSMLASLLPPSFLDIYSLSTSSLDCKAFCIICFLVLLSICFSSSLVHFKNTSKYLTRETAQVFIPLIRFLLFGLVSSCFLVLLGYSFFNFFRSFSLVLLPIFPNICTFPFLQSFLFFLDLTVPFLPSCVVSRFSLLAWRTFQCQLLFLCLDYIFSLPVCNSFLLW